MEKLTKKNKTYTVSRLPSTDNTPCIKITGKWLSSINIEIGTKLKIINSNNMIILIKVKE